MKTHRCVACEFDYLLGIKWGDFVNDALLTLSMYRLQEQAPRHLHARAVIIGSSGENPLTFFFLSQHFRHPERVLFRCRVVSNVVIVGQSFTPLLSAWRLRQKNSMEINAKYDAMDE